MEILRLEGIIHEQMGTIEKLRELLEEYGWHNRACRYYQTDFQECNCGYNDDVLPLLKEEDRCDE